MNMNFKLVVFILSLSLSMLGSAVIADVHGGGVTVDVDGRPTLKDLVDQTNCIWVKASDIAAQLPHFAVIEKNIDQEDGYLEFILERELKNLDVCQTQAPLVTISTKDQDGLTIDTTEETNGGSTQVGIRLNDEIYLSMPIFHHMSPEDQAYLLLHEAMHSFIPMDAPQRNGRLRSFISVIRGLEQSSMSTGDFAYQMKNDDVDAAMMTAEQAGWLKIALDTNTSLISRFAAWKNIGSFSSDGGLLKEDESVINDLYQQAETDFLAAILNGDLPRLNPTD